MKGFILLINKFTLLIVILFSLSPLAQSESAIKFEAAYTADVLNNYSGGLKNGTNYLGIANLKISFNTEGCGLWKGGHFFLNAINTHGGSPSSSLIGDFQGISNIEAGNLNYLHELWINQNIENLSITLGLQDLASAFAVSNYGAVFLNGSFGIHSTISSNIPSPVFPLTSLGVLLSYNLSDKLTIKTAAFDGLPDDFNINPHNLKWDINSEDGILSITELNYSSVTGTYTIGTYLHQSGGSDPSVCTNNYGFYFVGDHLIYKNLNDAQLAFFTQLGVSPANKNENDFYLGTGLNYKGKILNGPEDVIGLALAIAGFTNRDTESVIEFSYKTLITENISIQPDVQYIINPAGTGSELHNSLIGIIRTGISF